MGWTLAIAIGATLLALVHLLFVRIPEEAPVVDGDHSPAIDLRGSIVAIRAAPGLFALILFSTFNNLIGGVYMALMDPYGLTLFPVEAWGVVLGVTATGFIIGGLAIAKWGLGRNPIRTMLLVVVLMGLLGALFTIREWWVLYGLGIWLYMTLIPVVEAAEQTVIQKVVPFRRQGRVFGFAQAFEAAAAPITAFLIAPIAQFWIIPYMESDEGQATWGWLLGEGDARGIALVFLFSGLAMVVLALLAFTTRSYRLLSEEYQRPSAGEAPNEESAAEESPGEGSRDEGSDGGSFDDRSPDREPAQRASQSAASD
jgi:DHA3 family multidrug efflux protein-like MFS transporter